MYCWLNGNRAMNEILIYDIVGQDFFGAGVVAKDVKAQLDEMGEVEEITVRINSPGGDVFEGLAIYNLLNQQPAKVTVKVDGWAASIASIIAMAGDSIEMAGNAMLMIHNPYTFSIGDADELRAQADVLDKVKDSLIATYQARTEIDYDELSTLMDAETWFSADEAIERGLANGKTEGRASLANIAGFRWINRAPEIKEQPEPEPVLPTVSGLTLLERSLEMARHRADIARARLALKLR